MCKRLPQLVLPFAIIIVSSSACEGATRSESAQTHYSLSFDSEDDASSVPGYWSFYFDSTQRRTAVSLLVDHEESEHLIEVRSLYTLNPVKFTEALTVDGWGCQAEVWYPDVDAITFENVSDAIVPGERMEFTLSCDGGFTRSGNDTYTVAKQFTQPTMSLLSADESAELVPVHLRDVVRVATEIIGPDIADLSKQFGSTTSVGWSVTSALAMGFTTPVRHWEHSQGPTYRGYEDVEDLDPRLVAAMNRLNRSPPPDP